MGLRPSGAGTIGVLMVSICLVSGCAARQAPTMADRFVSGAGTPIEIDLPDGWGADALGAPLEMPDAQAPVPKASDNPTIETEDPELAAVLAAIGQGPTVESLLDVAAAYRRLGLLDNAYSYTHRALEMDPGNGRTRDMLARVWRDWGMPERGLPEAYRAVAATRDVAASENTLGTLLFAVGSHDAAQARFDRVLALDEQAAYAWNNKCYVSLMQGDADRAVDECRRALTLDPELSAAHHNLALVYAAEGRWAEARHEFSAGGDAAVAYYNLGIAYLADQRYGEAAEAFDSAYEARPELVAARDRARDARRLAAETDAAASGK